MGQRALGTEGSVAFVTSPLTAFTEMKATQAEMFDANLPLQWRDYCAHLAIPLNKCRRQNSFLPWTCEHEKHEYEKCGFELLVHLSLSSPTQCWCAVILSEFVSANNSSPSEMHHNHHRLLHQNNVFNLPKLTTNQQEA